MSLLAGYKANKAIATILDEQNVTTPEGKQAIQHIKKIGAPAIPKLIEALASTKNTSIIENLLLNFLDSSTLLTYLDALSNSDQRVVKGVTRVLSKSDDYNPNYLIPLFQNQEVSKGALGDILLSHNQPIDVKELVAILDKVSSSARPIIYRILEKHATVDHVSLLAAKTKTNEAMVRTFLASLLAKFDVPETRNTLIQLLSDPNKNVREATLRALAKLKAEDTVEVICQTLTDPDLTVQATAIEALVEINARDTIKYLIEVLQDESEYVRRAAVEVLNEIGDQRAIKDLLNALRDADWWVKVRAADALGSIGGPKVLDAVLVLIKDEDEFLRRTAVEILNTSKDIKAIDKLIEALQDEDWWVRERAVDALAALGDKRAVPPLLKMLDQTPEAGLVIVRALATLGDKRAITPILKQLNQGNDAISKEALNALKVLTDREHALDVQSVITQVIKKNPNEEVSAVASEAMKTIIKRFGMSTESKESMLEEIDRQIEKNEPPTQPVTSSQPIVMIDAALLQAGDVFNERYKVIKHVGKGAFGVVVLVEDTVVHDQFILKFLNPQVASDENVIRRFTHELRYARRITHGNVIRIYDFITEGRNYAISMEYFPSHPLHVEINRKATFKISHSINILNQICDAMSAAEAVNVVHRDLKPGNILINSSNKVKIVDFGLAAAASQADSRLTKTGILVGTPTYMAPEQVRGKEIDPRTDVYALGVIMYEMFTGTPPYVGEESMGIMFQHVEGDVRPPKELNPNIPDQLQAIILKTMSVDPNKRYQNFQELKNDLQKVAKEHGHATS